MSDRKGIYVSDSGSRMVIIIPYIRVTIDSMKLIVIKLYFTGVCVL